MPSHLPGCQAISAEAYARKHGHEEPERFSSIYWMKCEPECPNLQRAIQLGRELSERYSW